MRIAWLTPASAGSAIARYSRHVVEAVRRQGVDVDVWAPSARGAPESAPPDFVFGEDDRGLGRLSGYDVVVHNLGNHSDYHAAIYRASRLHPGVVILHDRSLSDLFLGLYAFDLGDRGGYLSLVEALYGQNGREIAERQLSGRTGRTWAETEQRLEIPFTEQALGSQRGAIVHSQAHATDVAGRWPGPLRALQFPTYPEWLVRPPRAPEPGSRVTLVTSGMVNPNKHVHDVIEALASDRALAARVRYIVVGRLEPGGAYPRELAAMIEHYALAGTVKLLGAQPPSIFERILDQAEVHVNLRYPAIEGGSASAAQQLASGRPLIAYDTGSYAELPDDAAIKVPPRDRGALVEALRTLTVSPARRTAVGAAGRREAEARSLERYGEVLLEFLHGLERWPWQAFAGRLRDELQALGMDDSMSVYPRVHRALAEILPPAGSRPQSLRR